MRYLTVPATATMLAALLALPSRGQAETAADVQGLLRKTRSFQLRACEGLKQLRAWYAEESPGPARERFHSPIAELIAQTISEIEAHTPPRHVSQERAPEYEARLIAEAAKAFEILDCVGREAWAAEIRQEVETRVENVRLAAEDERLCRATPHCRLPRIASWLCGFRNGLLSAERLVENHTQRMRSLGVTEETRELREAKRLAARFTERVAELEALYREAARTAARERSARRPRPLAQACEPTIEVDGQTGIQTQRSVRIAQPGPDSALPPSVVAPQSTTQ